jgi:hypothetical protein
MAKSIFRRSFLALIIFAAALAMPLKTVAQGPLASTEPGILAEVSGTQLPGAPLVASAGADSATFGRDGYFRANAAAVSPAIAIATYPSESKPHRFWIARMPFYSQP